MLKFTIISAIDAHQLNSVEDITVDLYDNNRTPIFFNDLHGVVSQKYACGCFYIELKISGESNKTITVAVC